MSRIMYVLFLSAVSVGLGSTVLIARSEDQKKEETGRPPAMETLGKLVGGVWVDDPGPGKPGMNSEFRYTWIFGGKCVRAAGVVNKGKPTEMAMEAILGWDEAKQRVYYFDFHGGDAVYQGWGNLKDGVLEFEFETAVGKPAKWRSQEKFAHPDSYEFTIFMFKDGKWEPAHNGRLKRIAEP